MEAQLEEDETVVAESTKEAERKKWKGALRKFEVASALVDLLVKNGAVPGERRFLDMLSRLLANLIAGEEIEIVLPVCPDYAHEGGTYTFRGLNGGVGIVAERALKFAVKLKKLFAAHGLGDQAVYIFAIGDMEATPDNCRCVGLSQAEFLARVRESKKAIEAEALNLGLKRARCELLTELADKPWEHALREAKEMPFPIPEGHVRGAMHERHSLYERWVGESLSPEAVREKVVGQAHEYIAFGHYLRGENRLVVTMDSLGSFVQFGLEDTPVVSCVGPRY